MGPLRREARPSSRKSDTREFLIHLGLCCLAYAVVVGAGLALMWWYQSPP